MPPRFHCGPLGRRIALRSAIALACLLTVVMSAHGHHIRYTTELSGVREQIANNSPAVGHVVVTVDFDLVTMQLEASFSGLQGNVVSAHIHAPTLATGTGTADVAMQLPTLLGFPTGVTNGDYDHTFDLFDIATFSPAFLAANGNYASTAMNSLFAAMDDGKAYFNIHTTSFGDGEIRGFFTHVPGDYNLTGEADAADYVVWRNSLGNIGDGLVADANDNNTIDAGDYTVWREHYGETGDHHDEATGADAAFQIPEPSTSGLLALLVSTLSAAHLRRQRRRNYWLW